VLQIPAVMFLACAVLTVVHVRCEVDGGGVAQLILELPLMRQEVGCGVMDWIELAQDRDRFWALVNAAINLQVA
jgi:hypothetical protein